MRFDRRSLLLGVVYNVCYDGRPVADHFLSSRGTAVVFVCVCVCR
jgi:hypothetical protein